MNRTSEPIVLDFSSIDGVNSMDGLRRVSGNAGLYVDLLKQFVERQSDSADRILTLVSSDDLATAERLAHTVKGVAGTIGAAGVQSAAGELERAIRERADRSHIEELRAKFAALLSPVVESVRQFLATYAAEASSIDDDAAPPDRNALKAVVETLGRLLEESDADAIELVRSERAAIRFLFTPDGFTAFERLVTDYSFDEAADQLRRAAAGKGF